MSTLTFSRSASRLHLIGSDAVEVGNWEAANNVDSHSEGIWPDGTYTFAFYNAHAGLPPSSEYGSHGIFIFNVPGRTGMGVHSGRDGETDGAGRAGFRYCTMGCIRSIDAATAQLVTTHAIDPIASILVAE